LHSGFLGLLVSNCFSSTYHYHIRFAALEAWERVGEMDIPTVGDFSTYDGHCYGLRFLHRHWLLEVSIIVMMFPNSCFLISGSHDNCKILVAVGHSRTLALGANEAISCFAVPCDGPCDGTCDVKLWRHASTLHTNLRDSWFCIVVLCCFSLSRHIHIVHHPVTLACNVPLPLELKMAMMPKPL
jgi:hypothetical protein